MERPLYLAPEDEEDEGTGKDFLYEFEEEKNARSSGEGRFGGEETTADQESRGGTAKKED